MNQPLRRFVSRAPRYVLRPNDRHMARYMHEQLGLHKTKLVNFSETGLAISVDGHAAPHVGERIKVELPIPGGDQIAWWAIVVRTELVEGTWWTTKEQGEQKVLVALRFEGLPEGHQRTIRKSLELRFIEDLKERRRQQFVFIKAFTIAHFWKILAYTMSIIIGFAILYGLSRPSANYDSERGSPWGQRFQFFEWQKD